MASKLEQVHVPQCSHLYAINTVTQEAKTRKPYLTCPRFTNSYLEAISLALSIPPLTFTAHSLVYVRPIVTARTRDSSAPIKAIMQATSISRIWGQITKFTNEGG